jgi:hypothetical protein
MQTAPLMGLMGLGHDGTLYLPNGQKLARLPFGIAALVQRLQHAVARLSWRF